MSILKRGLLLGAAFAFFNTVADAQDQGRGMDDLFARVATPTTAYAAPASSARLSDSDSSYLRSALASARRGDSSGFSAAYNAISDPEARKIATWAMIDVNGEQMSFFELDQARRDLADWPRGVRRQTLTEQRVETSGLAPQGIIDWFGGDAPTTVEGDMALASAYLATGREADAATLIRATWRDQVFEADVQRTFLGRFSNYLTPEDHIRRTDFLLYGTQGPATRDMLPLLDPDQRALAEARIALRSGSASADGLVSRLPYALQSDPGLIFERASALRRRDQTAAALALADQMGSAPGHDAGDSRVWTERRLLINAALRVQDYRAAYHAAAQHGLQSGADAAEAEFYAGWLALSKLNNPAGADEHFARIEAIGQSPITQGRALYWRGRAHEAMGDAAGARAFYQQGARHSTTFYGQLAAERAGLTIDLGSDPQITQADIARFEGREVVRAARILVEAGERDLFRVFALHLDDNLPNGAEYAQLVDLARAYGDQDTSMKVVRVAAQKGFILPERGYPLRTNPPQGGLETAVIFGITRQESGFDPLVRSGAGARGMMQLMPATAQVVARGLGVSYSASMLDDPDYNMRLGSTYINQMVNQFSGSYVMAIAAYNAGPGRPREWVTFCGDPRTSSTDPLDFIECIPFSETRNYVMRVMEGMQVYRARLNNGVTVPTLAADLKRGAYSYTAAAETPRN